VTPSEELPGQEDETRHKKLVFWVNRQRAGDIEYCGGGSDLKDLRGRYHRMGGERTCASCKDP
jgi:hypothetical protein